MPELAIVGYGKMGRMVDRLAPEFGFHVKARLDVDDAATAALDGIDVAIEFSVPSAVAANVERLAAARIPIVTGTTGWLDRLDLVREIVARHDGALVWSPNFSVGANVFNRLVEEAARLLAKEPEYGAWAWEIHHAAKRDAPSGTLLKLIGGMRSAGYSLPIDAGSNRAGAHPGTHEIGFDSADDTITLRHVARGREGFARGALKAAQWIMGRKGCFEFSSVLFGRD